MTQLFNSRINVALLKDAINKNKNFIIIFTIALFLAFPVPLLIDLYYTGFQTIQIFDQSQIVFVNILTAGILIIVPFLFFNYLTKKRSVDFMHSLPISRASLFLTYSAASLIMVLIPFFLTYWTGYSILYIFSTVGFQWEHLFVFIRSVLLFGAIQVPTILVIMNTGTLSDSAIFTLILFVAPFIAFFAFNEFTNTYLLGFTDISSSNILYYISPITFFAVSVDPWMVNVNVNLLTLYWMVFALVMYVISCSAYRHWKSEFSERPFNNDYFYPFVTSLFTVFLFIFMLSMFLIDYRAPLQFLAPVNLVIPILFTYVFYLVLDFIKHRTAKFVFKATKHYTYIVIFALSVSTIIFSTQGFGYAWRLPELDKVETVELSVDKYFDQYDSFTVTISKPESIEQIITVHEELVEQFKKANGFFNNEINVNNTQANVRLTYKQGDKKVLNRTFDIPEEFLTTINKFSDIEEVAIAKQALFTMSRNAILTTSILNVNDLTMPQFDENNIDDFKRVYAMDLATLKPIDDYSQSDFNLTYLFQYKINRMENNESYEEGNQFPLDARYVHTNKYLESLPSVSKDLSIVYVEPYYMDKYNFFHVPTYKESELVKEIDSSELKQYINRAYTYSLNSVSSGYILIEYEATDDPQFTIPIF